MKLLGIFKSANGELSAEIWGNLSNGTTGVVFRDEEAGRTVCSQYYSLRLRALSVALEYVSGSKLDECASASLSEPLQAENLVIWHM